VEQTLPTKYKLQNHIRIVTAGSLFDGHDAAINVMRRLLQSTGAEVIHLGHNRSVSEVVDCAIQEDVQGVAITSYQGGHVEYLKYMHDLFKERGANIRIFAGGGGTILPAEIEELQQYGIDRIYSPDDGREMGLQGMINDLLERCDFPTIEPPLNGHLAGLDTRNPRTIGQLISLVENYPDESISLDKAISGMTESTPPPVLGITGTGGSVKSSLVDELVRRFLADNKE
jgi:methylmalonyl-CoA mutase